MRRRAKNTDIPTPYMIDSGTREEYENISTDIEVLLEAKEGEEGVYLRVPCAH